MKVITLFLIGQIHRDPAAKILINENIKRLIAANIPVAYCAAENLEQTLDISIGNVQKCIAEIDKLLTYKTINQLLCRDPEHKKPYFKISQHDELGHAITRSLPRTNPQVLNVLQQRIMYLNMYPAELMLLKSLRDKKIPYFAIDQSESQKMRYIEEMRTRKNLPQQEVIRAQHMATQLRNRVVPTLAETGGVIIATAGTLDTHRIAAIFLQEMKKNPLDAVQVVTLPISVFSPYSIDGRDRLLSTIYQMSLTDTSDVRELYSALNIQEANAIETGEDQFKCEQFDKLFGFAMEAHQQQLCRVSIPIMDEKKQRALLALGVILQTQTAEFTSIQISSAWLLQYSRELLDIKKVKLSLEDHVEARKGYLTKLPHVTLEKTSQDNVVQIICPIRFFDAVKKAVEPWGDVESLMLDGKVLSN